VLELGAVDRRPEGATIQIDERRLLRRIRATSDAITD